ncbi:Dienelactone hydrolase [Thermomonospora echinospora]|uniref:Dienelactone hydrolase n=1 Tax=Thermomonospora echinospora TaxID=1992 RepID=A0A1H6B420_9ACTN|nr:dienelactone hydrolase family protein [Thermomonospora echinospora]SEG54886.1 Dienelactone hydrolase [Thermomonospora echinospora]
MTGPVTVRSLWWSAQTGGPPPFGTAHLKVYYPARAEGTDAERLTGVFPPDPQGAPYPVVVFCSGVNVEQSVYRPLAADIAAAGFVVVTFDRVAELFGGQVGLTPGVDLDAARPDAYGTRPTCPAIGAVLDALGDIDLLKGMLDLDRIALGGHSAGGTVVLQSARFFPGVRACFAYGTHTMVATMLGWPPGTVLPAQVRCPVLLGVGTRDGVIAGSSDRYGQSAPADPVTRTFTEALTDPGDLLAVLKGANHFAVADPVDPTAARAFLDLDTETDPAASRRAYTDLVVAFLRAHLRDEDVTPSADPALVDLRRR